MDDFEDDKESEFNVVKDEMNPPYDEGMKTFFDVSDDDYYDNVGNFYTLDAADNDVTENIDQ